MTSYQKITNFLHEHGRRLSAIDGPNKSELEFWTLGKRVLILQRFDEQYGGWELFTSSLYNRADLVLDQLQGLLHE